MTPFLTPKAYSGCDLSSAVGNEQDKSQENDSDHNCRENSWLDRESNRLAAVGMGAEEMGWGGIEPPTHGFSVPRSAHKPFFDRILQAVFCVKMRVTSG